MNKTRKYAIIATFRYLFVNFLLRLISAINIKYTLQRNMKKLLYGFFIILMFVLCSYKTANIIAQLDIVECEAKECIFESFDYGKIYLPKFSKYKIIPFNDKILLINTLGNYVKDYVSSEEFKEKHLETVKAIENSEILKKPIPMPKTADQKIVELQKKIYMNKIKIKGITNNDSLKNAISDEIEEDQAAIDELKSNPQTFEKEEKEVYAKLMKVKKEKEEELAYRKDLKKFIKSRLNEFIKLTDDINFEAKLVNSNGMYIFENPIYEAKSREWKMMYRCGKENINITRAFVFKWIRELETK